MITVTTPRVRNFEVGRYRRHRAGSAGRWVDDGRGVDGLVGAVVVMGSPRGRCRRQAGCRSCVPSSDLFTLLEQRVVPVAPLLLLVQQLVDVDWDDLDPLERVLEPLRLDGRRQTEVHE